MTDLAHGGLSEEAWAALDRNKVASEFYWNEALFREETDRIFHKSWVYIAHESEVPKPGDYVRKRVAGQELIVGRDEKDLVRVFFNRCTHRGNLVCMYAAGSARSFRCGYHGWVFDLDGSLRGVPRPDAYGDNFTEMRSKMGLSMPADTQAYGGFIFARLQEDDNAVSFEAFIAPVRTSIDRLLNLSPTGRLSLTGQSIAHRLNCNWKMVIESNVDNYHVNVVHKSLFEAVPGAFDQEEDLTVRHLGMGHTEVDFRPQYYKTGKPLQWAGAVSASKLGNYVPKLEERHGREKAAQVLVDGPPHTMIFPNLFLSQMNIMVVDPLSAEQTVAYTSPTFLEGAEELNRRTALQCSGAMGPAGLIIADDAEIGDRNQLALHTLRPIWLDLSRGLGRETKEGQGESSPFGGDETAQRGIWAAYKMLMRRDTRHAQAAQ